MLASLILLLSIGLTACVGGNDTVPTTITAKDELILLVGDTGKLSASVNYEAKDKSLTFISNDTSKITIDKNTGTYEALAVGNTTISITAFDGTKKTINVVISRLATDVLCNIQETETVIKDTKVPDTYYVVTKTSNSGETFAPIYLKTTVVPSDAKQDVAFSVNNTRLAKIDRNALIINLPKVNELNMKDVVVTITVDNVVKKVTFKICPYNSAELALNFSKGENKFFDVQTNTMNIYRQDVKVHFNSAFSESFGNITYEPDATFKIILLDKNMTLTADADYENNCIAINVAGIISPGESTLAKFVVTDKKTGQVWEQEINIRYDV